MYNFIKKFDDFVLKNLQDCYPTSSKKKLQRIVTLQQSGIKFGHKLNHLVTFVFCHSKMRILQIDF